jgi:hypothetical protein
MRLLPPSSGSILSSFIVWSQTIQFIKSRRGLLSSFTDTEISVADRGDLLNLPARRALLLWRYPQDRTFDDVPLNFLTMCGQANVRRWVALYCNLGGCSLWIQLWISHICIGSMSSHLMHPNLRPPVFSIMKCMCLLHFGQVGGGGFLGMAHPCNGREHDTLSHRWMPKAGAIIHRAPSNLGQRVNSAVKQRRNP